MKEINNLIRDYNPYAYRKVGNAYIVNTKLKKIVIKKRNKNDLYNYLNSRSFRYYPQILKQDDDYQISEFVNGVDMPNEQKILDMIDLVSLLHYKTTYYKAIDEDDYKKIYEDISNNIEHLRGYYEDLITIIESKQYYSPSELALAINISLVFSSLEYSKAELENWLSLIEKKEKQRFVVLHNNLRLEHFIKNDKAYLISWEKAKIDLPIFDLYKLFKRYSLNYDFESILKKYEKNYPLLKEEKQLLFILISLPDKIELNESEYKNSLKVNNMIESLYKAMKLIEKYSEAKKEYEKNK